MLDFKKLTINDRENFEKITNSVECKYCLQTFQGAYLWRNAVQVYFAIYKDFLFLKLRFHNNANHYMFPIGTGNYDEAFALIKEEAKEHGCCYSINQVLEHEVSIIEPFALDNNLQMARIRDNFEYWYKTERMATFSGKKLQPKRNHINQFLKNYPNWEYVPIEKSNIAECIDFIMLWERLKDEPDNEYLQQDDEVFIKNLPMMEELNMDGGILRVDGKIVALSVGCELNKEVKMIIFEKALSTCKGAYPMIFQQYVKEYCKGYEYVSRLEDVGDEGLRKAKQSYYPDVLQPVYRYYLCHEHKD